MQILVGEKKGQSCHRNVRRIFSHSYSSMLTPPILRLWILLMLLLLKASTSATTHTVTTTATTTAVRAVFALMTLAATVVANARDLLPVRVERGRLAGLLNSHCCLEELTVDHARTAARKMAKITALMADVVPVEPHVPTLLFSHLLVDTFTNRLPMVHVHLDMLSAALWPKWAKS